MSWPNTPREMVATGNISLMFRNDHLLNGGASQLASVIAGSHMSLLFLLNGTVTSPDPAGADFAFGSAPIVIF